MKTCILTASLAAAGLASAATAGSFFSETEDNNTLALANSLGSFDQPGGSIAIQGTLVEGDVDWFSFTLDNTASLSFFAAFTSSSGDGIMQIVADGGDVLAFDDDSGVGLMPAIQLSDLAAGTYFLGFSGFGDVDGTSVDSDELADGLGHSEDFAYKISVGFTVVPAPGSLALLGLGGAVAIRRRR